MSLKLYSFNVSSCAWRVRICLALKKVDYELVTVDKFEKTSEYLKMNPLGQVPLLVVGEKWLSQSMAMMEYIEEKYSGYNLLPKDLFLRAKVREICELICSGIQPLQNVRALKRGSPDCNAEESAKISITHGFKGLEDLLKITAGTFCVGNEITMADACLVPQVANASRFNVNMEPFPMIRQINETLLNNSVIQATHPKNQPDALVNKK